MTPAAAGIQAAHADAINRKRVKAELAEIEQLMHDDANTNAPAEWWAEMTKRHIRLGMELNLLEGRGAYDFPRN